MVDEERFNRKVNPMLLLGVDKEKSVAGDDADDKEGNVVSGGGKVSGSQPALVEATDFDVPSSKAIPARLNVKRKAVNGLNPFPPKRNPEEMLGQEGEVKPVEAGLNSGVGGSDKVSPSVDFKKDVFLGEAETVPGVVPVKGNVDGGLGGLVRKNIPSLPSSSAPAEVKDAEGAVEVLVVPVEVVVPVVVEPVVRRVNPLFLAGDEKEYTDVDAGRKGQERVLRPNFIITGERENVVGVEIPKRNVRKPFTVLPEGEALPRSQYSRKMDSNVDVEEWTDDESTDTAAGLGGEKDDFKGAQYSKGFHLTERDVIMIRFLARYRYAYVDQLARLVDSTPRTVGARLRKLEERGFIRKELIAGRQYLWVSRKAGNALVDIAFSEIKKGSLSYVTVAHTIGLANLGVEFERESGGKDLLGEGKEIEDWVMPANRWKLGIWGHPGGKLSGEMTVTEREIRQGQLRWRGGRSSREMRELVSIASGGMEPVELEEGQEGLFVVYGQGGAGGEHIPDLVVARERNDDGKPQHIAIELELTAKSFEEWRKVLRNFRDNGLAGEGKDGMYESIIYFTHKRSIMTGLRKADEEVGLGDKLIIRKYSPSNNSNLPFWG